MHTSKMVKDDVLSLEEVRETLLNNVNLFQNKNYIFHLTSSLGSHVNDICEENDTFKYVRPKGNGKGSEEFMLNSTTQINFQSPSIDSKTAKNRRLSSTPKDASSSKPSMNRDNLDFSVGLSDINSRDPTPECRQKVYRNIFLPSQASESGIENGDPMITNKIPCNLNDIPTGDLKIFSKPKGEDNFVDATSDKFNFFADPDSSTEVSSPITLSSDAKQVKFASSSMLGTRKLEVMKLESSPNEKDVQVLLGFSNTEVNNGNNEVNYGNNEVLVAFSNNGNGASHTDVLNCTQEEDTYEGPSLVSETVPPPGEIFPVTDNHHLDDDHHHQHLQQTKPFHSNTQHLLQTKAFDLQQTKPFDSNIQKSYQNIVALDTNVQQFSQNIDIEKSSYEYPSDFDDSKSLSNSALREIECRLKLSKISPSREIESKISACEYSLQEVSSLLSEQSNKNVSNRRSLQGLDCSINTQQKLIKVRLLCN